MTRVAIIALIVLGLLAGATWVGWSWRGAEVSELRRQQEERERVDTATALRRHEQTTRKIQEAQDAEVPRRQAAEVAARRAAMAGQQLRDELAETRRWVEGLNTSLAHEREAAARAVSVLTELLGQCSDRRRELALYADQAAGAGRTCERSFDALTQESTR